MPGAQLRVAYAIAAAISEEEKLDMDGTHHFYKLAGHARKSLSQ